MGVAVGNLSRLGVGGLVVALKAPRRLPGAGGVVPRQGRNSREARGAAGERGHLQRGPGVLALAPSFLKCGCADLEVEGPLKGVFVENLTALSAACASVSGARLKCVWMP